MTKHKQADANMPIGKLTQVKDFLPAPEELVVPEHTRKVTLFLSQTSIAFFKREAARRHTKYQRMIRALVDRYAQQYTHRSR